MNKLNALNTGENISGDKKTINNPQSHNQSHNQSPEKDISIDSLIVGDPAEFLRYFYENHYPEIERKWSPDYQSKWIEDCKKAILDVFTKKKNIGLDGENIDINKRSYENLGIETARKQLDLIIDGDLDGYRFKKHLFFIDMVAREMHRIAIINIYLDYKRLSDRYLQEYLQEAHSATTNNTTIKRSAQEALKKSHIIKDCINICSPSKGPTLQCNKDNTITLKRKNGPDITYTREDYMKKIFDHNSDA